MKFKSASVDIDQLKNNLFDPTKNISPENLYGEDWKGAKIFEETYTGYDDNNYFTCKTYALVHPSLGLDEVLIMGAAKQAAKIQATLDDELQASTFEEAMNNISFGILKANGLIPLVYIGISSDYTFDSQSDWSTYIDDDFP